MLANGADHCRRRRLADFAAGAPPRWARYLLKHVPRLLAGEPLPADESAPALCQHRLDALVAACRTLTAFRAGAVAGRRVVEATDAGHPNLAESIVVGSPEAWTPSALLEASAARSSSTRRAGPNTAP